MKGLLFFVPLAVMFVVGMFSMAGLTASPTFSEEYLDRYGLNGAWYDEDGHITCYENGTAYDEAGQLVQVFALYEEYQWINETSPIVSLGWVVDQTAGVERSILFDVTATSIGFFAIVAALVALGIIAGVRLLDSGLSGFSVKIIVMAAAFGGLWTVMSGMSVDLLTSIPIFGNILFFGLTLVYTIGSVFMLSGGGED